MQLPNLKKIGQERNFRTAEAHTLLGHEWYRSGRALKNKQELGEWLQAAQMQPACVPAGELKTRLRTERTCAFKRRGKQRNSGRVRGQVGQNARHNTHCLETRRASYLRQATLLLQNARAQGSPAAWMFSRWSLKHPDGASSPRQSQ